MEYTCCNCGKIKRKYTGTKKKNLFCSTVCHKEYSYVEYIKKWKIGEVSGCRGKNSESISTTVRRYIFEKFKNKCSECGWSKVNPFSNKIPLEVDHIDGNSSNHSENNLRLLCPNCHSLTKTFRALNKGKGRKYRAP